MKQAEALRDLAERLAEIAGGARLVANALGTAAIAAGEMCEIEPERAAARATRPTEIPVRFIARDETGSFSVSPLKGDPLAYAETREAAERIAAALNLAAAIEENSDAAAEG